MGATAEASVVPSAPMRTLLGGRVEFELSSLRWPGVALLAGGAAMPVLGHPGVGCVIRSVTGIPCPLCGMSTSVEDAVRLQLVDAVRANPAGVVAVIVALAAVLVRRDVTLRIPAYLVYVSLMLMWMFELVRFGIV